MLCQWIYTLLPSSWAHCPPAHCWQSLPQSSTRPLSFMGIPSDSSDSSCPTWLLFHLHPSPLFLQISRFPFKAINLIIIPGGGDSLCREPQSKRTEHLIPFLSSPHAPPLLPGLCPDSLWPQAGMDSLRALVYLTLSGKIKLNLCCGFTVAMVWFGFVITKTPSRFWLNLSREKYIHK